MSNPSAGGPRPFRDFATPIRPPSPLRQAITAAYRRDERDCLPPLIAEARLAPAQAAQAQVTARRLIAALRGKSRGSLVEDIVQEYSLSSQEGVALMCLAEALLRIPDTATRDALIRDKIADGDWTAHVGSEKSLFVNAATWGLVLTGKLVSPVSETSLGGALRGLIGRFGEPVIRRGVDMAMRMMGEQFVTGETIDDALVRVRPQERRGFSYSYDMLGEAAMTAADADRYFRAYEAAIHAIGRASAGRGIYAGPGISIKLSALHPRYVRSQSARVMSELLPLIRALALLAKRHDIGLNIDAEEADRAELSLDLLESLCLDPALSGWNGLGFVVQAYGKRCPFIIDFIIDLARRSQRRIMVRLVKGAYWDAEIKRAQVDGLGGFPVFTRKAYTDVSYLACARRLLAARDAVFPQFATHNAQSLAAIYHLAGPEFAVGDYEFQCLHGMGEPLYDEVIGADKLGRPCRIYAPVGTHETLLAYLVRRLLENGANSSFVNRIADPDVSIDELIADPVEAVAAMPVPGALHPAIALPADLYGTRRNASGLDLSNEQTLAELGTALVASVKPWTARPPGSTGEARPVRNPADHRDQVGLVVDASPAEIDQTIAAAGAAAAAWGQTSVHERAAILERAADLFQAHMPALMGLAIREAGKSAANAIAEVREAIDFLRYYAGQARTTLGDARPLGPIACISPWNFPLAIFTGQVAAALAAGNTVLAKPAEETPLIAAEGVRLLHEAGVPQAALHLVPGDGKAGAALTAAPAVAGVMFTGSTEVARLIQATLAKRTAAAGRPVPLIAETGGQNAMVVDSSALAEQVVADVLASAFDSAGQRCSALRILCLQTDIADRTLAMLKGALEELSVGAPDALRIDIGPVISAEAQGSIERHIETMRANGCRIHRLKPGPETAHGTFVAPTIIEIDSIAALKREVFGPVLHVIRFAREDRAALIAAINATGYGLTFGLHTRIDETIAEVLSSIEAGNVYINRNIIGAVVGVQPFGGRGLSGTGPKAGGPLYLPRLADPATLPCKPSGAVADGAAQALAQWLEAQGNAAAAGFARHAVARAPLGHAEVLRGPVGETNSYALHPRGTVLLAATSADGLYHQLAVTLASGNSAVILSEGRLQTALVRAPDAVVRRLRWAADLAGAGVFHAALVEGDAARVQTLAEDLAARAGPIVTLQANDYRMELLMEEVSISVNTTAAGGNASLMTIAL